ncbi:MAG TPA: hypothetical protein VJZ00_14325 [Thermoanaerobaculia bacterium]|nr:hypothetical protein [Thermoanaerobaculia bacterium]
MRRALLVLALFSAVSLHAEDAVVKRRVVAELLHVLDIKMLMQRTADAYQFGDPDQNDEYRAFRERLFLRIDYGKLADEVYAPLFMERFSTEELQALVAFVRTKEGRKLVDLIPDLGLGAAIQSSPYIEQAVEATREEMEKEDLAKHPWKSTLNDMRSIAIAVEARATDTNEYPVNVPFEQLEPLIAPTYIRAVPKVDAWGTPFFFICDGEHYRIVSAGADKRFEWSSRLLDLEAEARLSESLDADIIFQDGDFLVSPNQEP